MSREMQAIWVNPGLQRNRGIHYTCMKYSELEVENYTAFIFLQ